MGAGNRVSEAAGYRVRYIIRHGLAGMLVAPLLGEGVVVGQAHRVGGAVSVGAHIARVERVRSALLVEGHSRCRAKPDAFAAAPRFEDDIVRRSKGAGQPAQPFGFLLGRVLFFDGRRRVALSRGEGAGLARVRVAAFVFGAQTSIGMRRALGFLHRVAWLLRRRRCSHRIARLQARLGAREAESGEGRAGRLRAAAVPSYAVEHDERSRRLVFAAYHGVALGRQRSHANERAVFVRLVVGAAQADCCILEFHRDVLPAGRLMHGFVLRGGRAVSSRAVLHSCRFMHRRAACMRSLAIAMLS